MNARLYDAPLGRFLSPDPYVQAPDFSQSFNRYSYAWNNPLVYTDPDGEFVHLVIGAIIGGTLNWLANGAEFSWKGLGYFGVGAAAGALGAGVGAGISSVIAGGSFGAGFVGSSAALTASSSFISGAAISGGAGFASGFTTGFGNGLLGGQNFGQALLSGTKGGLLGGATGALFGGIGGGIAAYRQGRDFWDGFDYQRALDNAVANEGINHPNSRWLVANRKNTQLVNDVYNTNLRVSGNKIYMTSDEYSSFGVNIGVRGKNNITLITKQAIRNGGKFSLTDIIRHESTHQLQVLSGRTMSILQMEIGAYMTNILYPATNTTIQKVFDILVNDWGISSSTLWETILNIYPHGPIP